MNFKSFFGVSALLFLLSCGKGQESKSIVILYSNDVHCGIDKGGYEKIAGLRDATADTAYTLLVDQGDFISGGIVGSMSRGQWIIDIMKEAKYDVVTLGNHEFDIKPYVERQKELFAQIPSTEVTCLNLADAKTGKNVYAPYAIKKCGPKKVAFIGVLAPITIEMEPAGFYNEDGSLKYFLHPDNVVTMVQEAVDKVRKKGADYVIVLSHFGDDEKYISSTDLIKQTSGIDAVLDGHTHIAIDTAIENNKGNLVALSRTGTKFSYIGRLNISKEGEVTNSLIKPADVEFCNEAVKRVTDSIKTLRDNMLNKVMGQSEVKLKVMDEKGEKYLKRQETNAGHFVTDAYRKVMKADIGMVNSGGVRADIASGDVTNKALLEMNPFFNDMCVFGIKGAELVRAMKEILIHPLIADPINLHVSGMQYGIERLADGKCQLFGDIKIGEDGNYAPIDENKEYTIATTTYIRDIFFYDKAKATIEEKNIESMFDGVCVQTYFEKNLQGKITASQYPEDDSKLEQRIIRKGF